MPPFLLKLAAGLGLITGLVLGLMLLAEYAGASPALDDFKLAARSVGADVDIEEVEFPRLNAGFLPPGIYCALEFLCEEVSKPRIGILGDWSRVDSDVRFAVALHELGHYRQWKEHRKLDEWDADLYAANQLCSAGRDGIGIMVRAATVFVNDGGSWGDGHKDSHGSWYERIENVKANSTCRRGTDAPFTS